MTANSSRHLTWENFVDTLLTPGVPARHRIAGEPPVDLYVESGGQAIGILLPALPDEETPSLRSSNISIDVVADHGNRFFRLSTRETAVFQPFYFFIVLVTDMTQLARLPASTAIAEAMLRWDALRAGLPLLSTKDQLGLIGELWTLNRLAASHYTDVISSWIGTARESHDFRYEDVELEVKVTTQHERVHRIQSLVQLESTPSHRLFLMSLHLQLAGTQDGFSLNSLVDDARRLFAEDLPQLRTFEENLVRRGYRDQDREFYDDTYNHRAFPVLVPANECPRITAADVQSLLGEDYTRLTGIQYRIRIDGLGFFDGTREFIEILP